MRFKFIVTKKMQVAGRLYKAGEILVIDDKKLKDVIGNKGLRFLGKYEEEKVDDYNSGNTVMLSNKENQMKYNKEVAKEEGKERKEDKEDKESTRSLTDIIHNIKEQEDKEDKEDKEYKEYKEDKEDKKDKEYKEYKEDKEDKKEHYKRGRKSKRKKR